MAPKAPAPDYTSLNPATIAENLVRGWKLLFDRRISLWLKLIFVTAGAIYWISPIDLIPGMPVDDVFVLLVLLNIFAMMASNQIRQQPSSKPTPVEEVKHKSTVHEPLEILEE